MSKIVSPHFRNLLSNGVSKYCRANLLTALKRSLWERAKKFWTSLIKSSASGGVESSYNPRRVSNATVLTPGQKKLKKHWPEGRYFVFVLLWLGGSLIGIVGFSLKKSTYNRDCFLAPHTLPHAIYVSAAVRGMFFKQFGLEYGIKITNKVWV